MSVNRPPTARLLVPAVVAMLAALAGCSEASEAAAPTMTPSLVSSAAPTAPSATVAPPLLTTAAAQTSSEAEPAPGAIASQTVGGSRTTLPGTGAASGAAVPQRSPNGVALRWYDDFAGSTLAGGWGAYDAVPRSSPSGLWKPSQVLVRDSKLVLRAERQGKTWVSGGVSNFASASGTYGEYLVRFRITRAKGIKYALLLWPRSDRWPQDGEIDFAEDGGGNRSATTATMHYGDTDQKVQRSVKADFSRWHTVGVRWEPGRLTYTLDGAVWGTVVSPNVPSGPMDLAMQTEYVSCGNPWGECPDASTPSQVDLEVDWVAVYRAS